MVWGPPRPAFRNIHPWLSANCHYFWNRFGVMAFSQQGADRVGFGISLKPGIPVTSLSIAGMLTWYSVLMGNISERFSCTLKSL